MVRKLALAISLAVGSLPMSVYALGMGGMKTYSALNEKFKADIELVSVQKGALDTLKVSLAPAEVFSRVGLERSYFLTQLKFQPMRLKNGKAVIRVTSDKPIREPFLDFFIKVDWPNGQAVREYTALLDPPVVTKRSAPRVSAPSRQESGAVPASVQPAASVSAPRGELTGDQYGPVQSNETLWEIADSLRPSGISIHQMMMALYKANPDAFLNNNINLLKRGRVLKVPAEDEIKGIGRQQAVAEFQEQVQAWESDAGQMAAASTDEGSAGAVSAASSEEQVVADGEEQAQLKIAAAPAEEAESTATEQAVSDLSQQPGSGDLKQKLLLLEEEAETARQESTQLRSEVDELRQQLEDAKRLLQLKDEELARLQEGMAQTNEMGDAEETTQPEMTETEVVELEETVVEEDSGTASTMENETEAAAEADSGEEASGEMVEGGTLAVEETEAVVEQAPVEQDPAESVEQEQAVVETEKAAEKSTPEKAPSLTDSPVAWLQDNWMLAAGGGAALLVLLAAIWGRRRKEDEDGMSASSVGIDHSVDQESILMDEESDLADTVADNMAAGAVGDTSFLSEYSTEEFKGLQEDTAEVDPVSEADVYIAYGRYQQAEEILREAMAAGNNSAAVKYKMLEVYYATQKKDEFAELAREMVETGQAEEDPNAWEHIQTMGRDLDKSNSLFAAGAAAATATAATASASGAELEEDSELSLDLSTLAEEVDSALNVDSEALDDFGDLDLDLSSLPADEAEGAKTDDSISTDQLAPENNEKLAETELHTELLDINDLGDLDVGSTNLDEALADLSGDLEGVMADSQILDEPLDLEDERLSTLVEEITPDSQISGLEDDLNVTESADSVIGDEVETKLELAKAFMEIGDADGARSILQEVEEDGTPEQKETASQLLNQIED